MVKTLLIIVLAYIIDLLIGDPTYLPHPVRAFGMFISNIERIWNRGRYKKIKGIAMLIFLLIIVLLISYCLIIFSYRIHPILGIVTEAVLIATTIAQKGLEEAALTVYKPLDENKDLDAARTELAKIVSRDTKDMDERTIIRSTIETVAENISDAITAPLFWAFIGGAPLALLYRAVNTCDSMVGYKTERYKSFGWASARFDDFLNLLPARLTAFIIYLLYRRKHSFRWSDLRSDAKQHKSINSGWLEASVAYSLNIQLGGVNYYNGVKIDSPKMGSKIVHPESIRLGHVKQVISVMKGTLRLFLTILISGGILYVFTYPWIKSTLFI